MRNLEKMCKVFLEEKDSNQVKYRCKIISRQISIKVLWQSFYSNIPIKSKLKTTFIILQTSYIIIVLIPCHLLVFIFFIDQYCLPIIYLGLRATPPSPQLFQNCSRRDHHQVQLSRMTYQNCQLSSQYPG